MALLESRIAELRDCVERVGDELRARLGTTQSRRALVRRFKQRCEWQRPHGRRGRRRSYWRKRR